MGLQRLQVEPNLAVDRQFGFGRNAFRHGAGRENVFGFKHQHFLHIGDTGRQTVALE